MNFFNRIHSLVIKEFQSLLGCKEGVADNCPAEFVSEVLLDVGDGLKKPFGMNLLPRGHRHDVTA